MMNARCLQFCKYISLKNINNTNLLSTRRMSFTVPGYNWEYMSAETFPAAMELMTKYFCVHEPATKAIGLANNPKAVEEFQLYCADTALDGISVVIKDLVTNEVVGTGFNKLVIAPDKKIEKFNNRHYWTQPESKHFVIDFVDQISKKVDLFKKYGVTCIMELGLWSVHPNHRNKKIGNILGQWSVTTALKLQDGPVSKFTVKDLGPKYAMIEEREIVTQPPQLFYSLLTSQKTQTVAKRFGCVSDGIISFNDLYYNGKSYTELLGEDDEFNVEVITYLLCKELKRKYQLSLE